jgi:hypothetical protein
MFELNGSETSWLVYADWLEDQNIDASNIRNFVHPINEWCYEIRFAGIGSVGGISDAWIAAFVTTGAFGSRNVGTEYDNPNIAVINNNVGANLIRNFGVGTGILDVVGAGGDNDEVLHNDSH